MKKIDYSFISVIVILTFVYILNYMLFGSGVPCIIHRLTNLYCPGCGVTRMFLSLLKGQFYQAFRYNAFVFILLIASIIYLFSECIYYICKKRFFSLSNGVYIALVILSLSFGIIRNIPYFSYLLPTEVNYKLKIVDKY